MVNLFRLKTGELKALVLYKEIYVKDLKFPKDFWTTEKEQKKGSRAKCRILTRYCLEDINKLGVKDLPAYNLKQIKNMLIDGKLFGMVQTVFRHDVLEILKNAYPEEFRTRALKEWMWSKHGIWYNDAMIIEAVNDMVRAEGIRRVEHIPSLNWKKRLLKHGIYNVLMYFNWSIFSLFNFVYPNKFHPTDFKYKLKWAAAESLDNAFYFMHKTFRKKRYSMDQIVLLSTSDFRKLGLAGMLAALFDSSALRAKEYYLYKTIGNKEHQDDIQKEIRKLLEKKHDTRIIERMKAVAVDKYIYNLHSNYTLYGFIKRHARLSGKTIEEFIADYGFVYKTAKKHTAIDKEELWGLRKQGLTYVEIANRLDSNPNTISELCRKYFGGDPLIPRPIEEYATVQELMEKYRVDHKTIMKLAKKHGIPDFATIRFRYIRKPDIEPILAQYSKKSRQHLFMVQRYARNDA